MPTINSNKSCHRSDFNQIDFWFCTVGIDTALNFLFQEYISLTDHVHSTASLFPPSETSSSEVLSQEPVHFLPECASCLYRGKWASRILYSTTNSKGKSSKNKIPVCELQNELDLLYEFCYCTICIKFSGYNFSYQISLDLLLSLQIFPTQKIFIYWYIPNAGPSSSKGGYFRKIACAIWFGEIWCGPWSSRGQG